jgi:hypothetical protein
MGGFATREGDSVINPRKSTSIPHQAATFKTVDMAGMCRYNHMDFGCGVTSTALVMHMLTCFTNGDMSVPV